MSEPTEHDNLVRAYTAQPDTEPVAPETHPPSGHALREPRAPKNHDTLIGGIALLVLVVGGFWLIHTIFAAAQNYGNNVFAQETQTATAQNAPVTLEQRIDRIVHAYMPGASVTDKNGSVAVRYNMPQKDCQDAASDINLGLKPNVSLFLFERLFEDLFNKQLVTSISVSEWAPSGFPFVASASMSAQSFAALVAQEYGITDPLVKWSQFDTYQVNLDLVSSDCDATNSSSSSQSHV